MLGSKYYCINCIEFYIFTFVHKKYKILLSTVTLLLNYQSSAKFV